MNLLRQFPSNRDAPEKYGFRGMGHRYCLKINLNELVALLNLCFLPATEPRKTSGMDMAAKRFRVKIVGAKCPAHRVTGRGDDEEVVLAIFQVTQDGCPDDWAEDIV
jgi:hypothetical protein